MSELLALTFRHLREMTRGRLARAALVLFVVALVLAAWLGTRSAQAESLMLLGLVVAVALLAAGAALSAGGALPEDRVAGREEWLATLAPPAWKRRAAAALAGWTLAVALGTLGGFTAGIGVRILRPDVALRPSQALGNFDGHLLTADTPEWWELDIPRTKTNPEMWDRWLEVEVQPRYRSMLVPIDRVDIAVETDGVVVGKARTVTTSVRGPIRVELGKDHSVRMRLLTAGVALRVGAVRTVNTKGSTVFALGWAGFLIGLLAGCVAPLAVLVSRLTTGQTAVAAACLLLLFGVVKGPLLTLAADLELGGAGEVAAKVLRGVGYLAPDASLLPLFGETAAHRVAGGIGLAGPALLYGLVCLLLVSLPAPRRFTEGTNA